jgi:hypothetical protein
MVPNHQPVCNIYCDNHRHRLGTERCFDPPNSSTRSLDCDDSFMGIQTTVKPKTQGNMPAQCSGKMVQTGVFHLVFNCMYLQCFCKSCCKGSKSKVTKINLHPQACLSSLSCCVCTQTGTYSPTSMG